MLKMDEMIQERVAQKENELNATYDERLRNYEDRYYIFHVYRSVRVFMSPQRAGSPTPIIVDQKPVAGSANVQ